MESQEQSTTQKEECSKKGIKCNPEGCGGLFYGLGFIGAAIYFVSISVGFWGAVVGILKAIVWPAYLVFELLKFLGV